MNKKALILTSVLAAFCAQAQSQPQLNIICSVPADWCNKMGIGFERFAGTKVNLIFKNESDTLVRLNAEKEDPKMDLWFGGIGDAHLYAADEGLTQQYKSLNLFRLHPWAQKHAELSDFKTVGIYSGILGFGYNADLLAKKKISPPKSWADLLQPSLDGEVLVGDPALTATGYTMLVTLVQLLGEDRAFAYMKRLHANINKYTQRGITAIKSVARGEALVSISFISNAAGEVMDGYPVKTVTPSEGTAHYIGAMSIVKEARNLEAAKQFYEWALTPVAQEIAVTARQFQLPSNRTAKDPLVLDFGKVKFIKYDYAKYGDNDERNRLIARFNKEIRPLPH